MTSFEDAQRDWNKRMTEHFNFPTIERAWPKSSIPLADRVDSVVKEIYRRTENNPKHTVYFAPDASPTGVFWTMGAVKLRKNIVDALKKNYSPKEVVEGVAGHMGPLGSIHIGGAYRQDLRKKRMFGDYGAGIRELPSGKVVSRRINRFAVYHPSHVANNISHEVLHESFNKVGEPWEANRALDNYRLFGFADELSPTGLIDFEILRGRMARRKGRLTK